MKTEGEFNAYLSKEFKKRGPSLYSIKIADKFTIGVSDFIIFYIGKACGLEVKFISDWPARSSSLILKHPFAGAQKTFLESVDFTGNCGYGLLAVESDKCFYIMRQTLIPDSGNWTHSEFDKEDFFRLRYDQIDELIKFVFDIPF